MGSRAQLQTILEGLAPNVYFQPSSDVQMAYPCIVYQYDNADTEFAGNFPYKYTHRYQITAIDRDPDSPIPDKIAKLPMTLFSRFFVADKLNQTVFTTYF